MTTATMRKASKEKHPVSSDPVLTRFDTVRMVSSIHSERVTFGLWLNNETEFTG